MPDLATSIREVEEAEKRLTETLLVLHRFDLPYAFTETEVRLRVQVVVDVTLVALSDLRSMKEGWMKEKEWMEEKK